MFFAKSMQMCPEIKEYVHESTYLQKKKIFQIIVITYTLSYLGSKFVLEKFFQRTSKVEDSDFEFLGTVQVEHTI